MTAAWITTTIALAMITLAAAAAVTAWWAMNLPATGRHAAPGERPGRAAAAADDAYADAIAGETMPVAATVHEPPWDADTTIDDLPAETPLTPLPAMTGPLTGPLTAGHAAAIRRPHHIAPLWHPRHDDTTVTVTVRAAS